MKLSTTIVIPTYNGLKLLKKHLKSVVKYSNGHPIIIVDDCSSDDSVSYIKSEYPQIKVIQKRQNQGFVSAVNTGFAESQTDLVLLLNNDVTINQNTLPNLVRHFENSNNLFGVGAKEILPNGDERGKSIGRFERGLVIHNRASNLDFGPTFWVFGASGLFSKKIWNELGGMDMLYQPAYWEDIDISYRAWKAGYDCLFEPKASVLHETESTMNFHLGNKKSAYAFKNQILFVLKNVTDFKLILLHLFWLPYHLVITTLRSRGMFLYGFFLSLFQLSQVMTQSRPKLYKRSDEEIFKIFVN